MLSIASSQPPSIIILFIIIVVTLDESDSHMLLSAVVVVVVPMTAHPVVSAPALRSIHNSVRGALAESAKAVWG